MLCRQDPVSGRLIGRFLQCALALLRVPCQQLVLGLVSLLSGHFQLSSDAYQVPLGYKNTAGPGLYVYLIRFENTYTRHRAIPVLDGNGQRDSCGPRGIEEEDGTRPRRQLERGCQTSLRGNHTEKTDARSRRIHRQASRVLEDPRLERSSRDPKMAGP